MKTEQIAVVKDEAGCKQVVLKLASPIAYGWAEPEGEAEFVLVSAVSNGFANETFIFPCDEGGEVINWSELDGSHNRGMDIPLAVQQFEERH